MQAGPTMTLARRDWPVLLGLYLLTAILRLPLITTGLYGDEGWHYFVSKTWGAPVANFHLLDLYDTVDARGLFLWRPLFFIALTPAALISFEAYRALFVLYTSLIAPLLFLVLRELWVRRILAAGAGLAFAISPYFITWGDRVFPDVFMSTFFLAGLWFLVRRQPIPAAILFVVAMWVKEAALVAVGGLLLLQSTEALTHGRLSLRPLRIPRMIAALGFACVLGLVPLFVGLRLGITFPGWSNGTLRPDAVDLFFGSAWLIPLILIGIAWPRTRTLSLLALIHPVFYVTHNLVRGRAIEVWYYALPQLIALVAAIHNLDEAALRSRARLGLARAWPKAAAIAVALLFALGAVVPSTVNAKSVLTPASQDRGPSIQQAMDYERSRDRTLADVMSHVQPADWESVFLLDVGWFFLWYPFGTSANVTRWAFTVFNPPPQELHRWVHVGENMTRITVLFKTDLPLNEAFRETYVDCTEFENADYLILRPSACPGRLHLLTDNYQAHSLAASHSS